ncbi:unnamed protein product [Didymodactylos carnosus]|uniref:Uncharacterized protein n=1 Tax=Didymodactylos carnosus TaxID=1234261 RepID=A0A814TIQ4_9BILA|nr:unnamed protein product [Didymodactylos carnosus]CAF3925543.1 unnamed protein product [Didymodactylos carnosus]
MHPGHSFSKAEKEIFFKVITTVESEKHGVPSGYLYNTTERLQNMLGISHGALYRLKNEMHNLQLQATAHQHQYRSAL